MSIKLDSLLEREKGVGWEKQRKEGMGKKDKEKELETQKGGKEGKEMHLVVRMRKMIEPFWSVER